MGEELHFEGNNKTVFTAVRKLLIMGLQSKITMVIML